MAGLVDDFFSKDYSEEEREKLLSHSAALKGVFLPLLKEPSSLTKESFLGAKEALNLTQLREPLLPALESAQISFEHRLAKEHEKRGGVSIILPVFNALDALKPCLKSLEGELSEQVKLIIVNDASDSHTSSWLQAYAKSKSQVSLLEHELNQGFIAACATGYRVAAAEDDVVVINSDVVLSPGSIERIQAAACSSFRTGVASCLSTSSHHLQLDINPGDSLYDAQDFLSSEIKPTYPTVITPEGQFIYFRRWALERFGFFDEVYGRGFCEESDLSMRYFLNGVDTVCCDNSIIHHRHAASFGEEKKNKLIEKNRPIFEQRWGEFYWPIYQAFIRRDPLSSVRDRYKQSSSSLEGPDASQSLLESYKGLSSVRGIKNKSLLKDAEVVFVLPSIVLGGGTLSVLQHVEELLQRGVSAKVVSLTRPSIEKLPLSFSPIVVSKEEFFGLDWRYQKVIATFWLTAFYVKELTGRFKGLEGYYYIQDYEPWFYSKPEDFFTVKDAEETYGLGLKNVAKTEFLKQQVFEKHGADVSLITPGVNNCLLYTSPSPRDATLSRMPSSA